MTIRPMVFADAVSLAAMERICFSDPWSESAFEHEMTNPLSTWLVAEEAGAVIGYVGAQTVLDEADIMNIAVLEAFRRQGIAESLICALIDVLRDKQVARLFLEVRVSNDPALSLYRKLGFEEVGRRKNYYRHPREDAYILRKELC